MLQQIVRVTLPVGLDIEFPFRATQLRDYRLLLVSESEFKRHRKQFEKMKKYMLRLNSVIWSEFDMRKVAAVFGLDDARIVRGSKLATQFLGVKDGEPREFEIPYADYRKFELRKRQPGYVYQEDAVLSWQDDDRIMRFFRTEAGKGKHILPFEYFLINRPIMKDWNEVFPEYPIPPADPERTSGLFYYESF